MHLTVREYGHIGVSGDSQGLDYVSVPQKLFDHLKELALKTSDQEKSLLRPSKYGSMESLQVLNYVGILGIDDKTQLEILPKTTSDQQSLIDTRALLWKMLQVVSNVTPQETTETSLHTLPNSWLESLTRVVLKKITFLVRSGIKRDYVRREEHSSFLKGQLQLAKQMRARPGTEHKFHISYDQYLTDRAENRLLKSTLQTLNRWTTQLDNKRLCRELLFVFDEVPESTSTDSDLGQWRNDRGMAYYQPLLPWIKLILNEQSPVFSKGSHHGISLLFPMEKLFEEYVFRILRRDLQYGFRLKTQASSEHLLSHKGKGLFKLKPDGLITKNGIRYAVLDTKWKLLDASLSNSKDKYKLSQADFYQMFAYGMKYLAGSGELFLIYPSHQKFQVPLEYFEFNRELRLWALPFDLQSGELAYNLGTPLTEWYSGQAISFERTNSVLEGAGNGTF